MSSIHSKAYFQAFDMSLTNNRWAVKTSGADTYTVSAEPLTTWSTGVITIYRSSDGVTPYALESAKTLTAAEMENQDDCSGYPYLIFQVTTTVASTYVNITVNLMRSVST